MKRLIAVSVLSLLCALPRPSSAVSNYLDSFNSRYGTAGTRLNSCQLCHTSVPARNSYGSAFGKANQNFAAIENLDSDGDGYSNITEINARYFPGNAADHPSTSAPVIGVTPTILPFGNVIRNSAAMLSATITNTGNAALSITALTITGSAEFGLANAPALPLNVPAGSSAKVDVRYAPTNTGADNGNLAIASNDSAHPTVNVALSGTGILMPAGVTNATAIVNGAAIVLAGATNTFTSSGVDAGGNSVSCLWDFSDGSTSTDCSTTHVYTNCQSYTVTYSATNNSSATTTNFTVSVPCAMSVTNFQAKLNFAKSNLESCRFQAVPQPSQCTNWLGTVVAVDVGGAQVSWTLDQKGRGVSTNGTCKFSYNKKTGLCTLTAKLSRGAWQTPWAAHGLTNANYAKPGVAVTLPVILLINDDAFMADKPLHYTATAGKSGIAK